MIGAAVYRLRAERAGHLPEMHGRLLHAAFFAALRELSPDISAHVHDEMNVKPFTIACLRPEKPLRKERDGWRVREGDTFLWRVTGLNELMICAMASMTPGVRITVGSLSFAIEKAMLASDDHRDAGVIDENDLIAACLSVPDLREITFRFISPVSFRAGTRDYPWPLPAYVFGSLADKWTQAGLPGRFQKREIHEEAEALLPLAWRGETKRLLLGERRGILAFTGTFTYGLDPLDEERRQAFLILAQFATFSGVGRLTGQGLGETRVTYR